MTLLDLDNFETDIGIHLPYVIKLTLKIHRHMNAKAPFWQHFTRGNIGKASRGLGIGEVAWTSLQLVCAVQVMTAGKA